MNIKDIAPFILMLPLFAFLIMATIAVVVFFVKAIKDLSNDEPAD